MKSADVFKSSPIIKCNDLTFYRGERKIFDNISLSIPSGKITAIMGPSGCGKTTLLRLIGRQVSPDSGTVYIDNKNIADFSRSELYNIRKKMGMLFQSGALFSDLSVFENVAFPLREHTKLSKEMIRDLVLMKLHAVGLRGAHNLMPHSLSGGMARRVSMARAIALDPRIIMYDEPFTGQDPISLGVLQQLIKNLNDTLGITSILVSHDIEESLSIADYVYVISKASIVGRGTPDEIRNSTDPWIKQFINGAPDGPVPFHYPTNKFEVDLWNDVEDQRVC